LNPLTASSFHRGTAGDCGWNGAPSAIYELRNEQTLDQVLALAGGVLVSGELRNIKVARIEAHQRKVMLNVNLPQNGDLHAVETAFKSLVIKDGDDITVSPFFPTATRPSTFKDTYSGPASIHIRMESK